MATLQRFCTIASVAALMIFPLSAQPQDKPTESQQTSKGELQQAEVQKHACEMLESLHFYSEFCKVGLGGGSVYVGTKVFRQNGTANLINANDLNLQKKAVVLKTDY
jgi:hypothetical protein